MTPQERKNFEWIRDNMHGEQMTQVEAMKLALEALEEINKLSVGDNAISLPAEIDTAMDGLRQALEQSTEQESVAWMRKMFLPELGEFFDYKDGAFAKETDSKGWTPLYTQPQEATTAWAKGYQQGIEDERTSEANMGIAGFNAKVQPARQNPYTHPQEATQQCQNCASLEAQNSELDAKLAELEQEATRKPLTDEQIEELMDTYDIASIDYARAIEAAHGITGEKE